MFNQIWKRYLPIIAILLKRSVDGEQTLQMNQIDFVRAAGGRKIKFSFSNLHLNNGKVNYTIKITPLANELALLLQADEQVSKLLKQQSFEFFMGNDFLFTIKNNTVATEVVESNEVVDDVVTD